MIFLSVLSPKKAIPNVKGPSLPKNIVTVRMILAAVDKILSKYENNFAPIVQDTKPKTIWDKIANFF